MLPFAKRLPRCALLVLFLSACTTWSAPRVGRALDGPLPGGHLVVTRSSGERVELVRARQVGDSLVGELAATRAEIAIPRSDIAAIRVGAISAGRTVLLVGALGATAILVVNALRDDPPPPPPPPPPGGSCSGCTIGYSCPLVYSWDGVRWRLDSGTFGGAIMAALQRTDLDNLESLRAVDGVVRLRVTNELQETDHVDHLAVLAVDHDADVTVAPDGLGGLHALARLERPLSATDLRGRDVMARVGAADGWGWESALDPRDPDRAADLRDGIEVVFARPVGARTARLVLDASNTAWAAFLLGRYVGAHGRATQAWYDSLDASPPAARALGRQLAREAFLRVEVLTGAGWAPRGLIWEAGPEILKRQVLALDLADVLDDTVRLRLTSIPAFWYLDRVAMDFGPERPIAVRELELVSARDRLRGDVAPLIAREDRAYYTLETGDAADLVFRAPAPGPGRARSYILRSSGWYRVHTDETGEPDARLLAVVHAGDQGLARAAVAELERVRALAVAAR